jgi:hypothetical protein
MVAHQSLVVACESDLDLSRVRFGRDKFAHSRERVVLLQLILNLEMSDTQRGRKTVKRRQQVRQHVAKRPLLVPSALRRE